MLLNSKLCSWSKFFMIMIIKMMLFCHMGVNVIELHYWSDINFINKAEFFYTWSEGQVIGGEGTLVGRRTSNWRRGYIGGEKDK